MALDYVALRRVIAFGPNSRFTAYHYRLYHGLTVEDGKEITIGNHLGKLPYKPIAVIYNTFGHPEIIHPGLSLLVSTRVMELLNICRNVDFSEVTIAKSVCIPYGDRGRDEFLTERFKGIMPEQLLLAASTGAEKAEIRLHELIAPQAKDLPTDYLNGESVPFFFKQSQKEVLINVRREAGGRFPIIGAGVVVLIRRDVWATVREFVNPRFFELALQPD